MMRAYWSVMTLRFREILQYRTAAWAGVFTQTIFGFIILLILKAFYASSTSPPPMSLEQVIAYVWLGQAMYALLPTVDRDVETMVRSGGVAYEMVRPINLYTLWFCRTIGWKLAAVLLRGVPLLLIVGGLFRLLGMDGWMLPVPASPVALAMFAFAFLAAVLLSAAIIMVMHVVIVVTLDADGVKRIVPAFVVLLSGNIIPLPLFPDALQPVLRALPFRGLLDVPLRIYSGHIPAQEAPLHVGLTLAWSAALILAGRWLMSRGLRQIVVQGG